MNILGINAYHADTAACLIKNGHLIAAAEEESEGKVNFTVDWKSRF